MWNPISFPITAEHGEILTERGGLSVSPNIAEHGEILTKCGTLSVSRLLLNMGKSLGAILK